MELLRSSLSLVAMLSIFFALWIGAAIGAWMSRRWWVATVLGVVNAGALFAIVNATNRSPKFVEASGEILIVYLAAGVLAGLVAGVIGTFLRQRKARLTQSISL